MGRKKTKALGSLGELLEAVESAHGLQPAEVAKRLGMSEHIYYKKKHYTNSLNGWHLAACKLMLRHGVPDISDEVQDFSHSGN